MKSDSSQPPIQASTVIRNIGQLVTVAQQPIAGATGVLQVLSDAAIAVHDGVIAWIGPNDHVEPVFQHDSDSDDDGITIVDAQGVLITPGFVDSHTHLVFESTNPGVIKTPCASTMVIPSSSESESCWNTGST